MKKLIYLSIIILVNACVDQDTPGTTFILQNDSSYDVRIIPYSRNRVNGEITDGSTKGDVISIIKGDRKTIVREHRENKTFYSIENVDAVRVIFDESKVLIFICNDWPSMTNCSTIFLGDSDNKHVITEQDYESAQDCNGNCN